jgi:hypothetical protein
MHTLDRVVSRLSLLSRVAIEDTVRLDAQKSSALSGCKLQLSVILLLCTGILSFPALAQVKIREKIEIRPTEKPNAHTDLPETSVASLPPGWYVAPSTGTYFGQIGELWAKNEAPTGSITVTTRDTTLVFNVEDYIARRGSDDEIAIDRCNDWAPVFYTAHYAVAYQTQLGFLIPGVHQGDTLKFSYDGCTSLPKQTRSHTVEMALRDPYADRCYVYYEGELQELVYCGIDLTLSYQEAELDHFAITTQPDTLINRQIAPLTAIAVDENETEVSLDVSTLINLSFDEGQEYVDFISLTGDTVNVLENVPYGTLRSGQIKVIARGEPAQVASIKAKPGIVNEKFTNSTTVEGYRSDYPRAILRVIMTADATKTGVKGVYLKPEIKVIAAADSVQPRYPNHIEAEASRTEVKISVTVCGRLYAGLPYGLEILSRAIEGSGGHSHNGNRPTGRFIENSTEQLTLQKETTGDTIRVTYQASLFGGEERIVAKLNLPAVADSDVVVVRVPNLVSLPSGANNLITYTSIERERYHSRANSNYGRPDVVEAISQAVRDYAGELGLENDIFLAAIDMSLRLGGKFEINGDWESGNGPHQHHRVGKSVDFSHTYRDNTGRAIDVDFFRDNKLVQTTNQINEQTLDKFFHRRGFDRWERAIGKIHYESRN